MRRRVVLVPQSTAATSSAIVRLSGFDLGQLRRDPLADRIRPAGQVMRIVRVQTLHTLARSPDTARWPWSHVTLWYHGVSFQRVRNVARLELVGVDGRFGADHTLSRFETAHDEPIVVAHQPVSGWHRCSVVEQRLVSQHHGQACGISDYDFESTLRRSSEKPGDGFTIGGGSGRRHPIGG